MDRKFAAGMELYGHLNIDRNDVETRQKWRTFGLTFFGAPAGIFVTVDRCMGASQWGDLGMFVQNIMLLAVDAGLATCAMASWAEWPESVTEAISIPPERMLYCGIAIGYEDTAGMLNKAKTTRANHDEWLKFWN